MVWKAWDYARTIFQSEKLRISYIKADKDTRKHIFWYFEGQNVKKYKKYMTAAGIPNAFIGRGGDSKCVYWQRRGIMMRLLAAAGYHNAFIERGGVS